MPIQMDLRPFAMPGLEEKRDDGADDENRLEPLAQNDQQTLKERLGRAAGRPRQLNHFRHVRLQRVQRALGAPQVVRPHRALEVVVQLFHRRDDAGIARPRARLDRLEREIRVERAIARVTHASVANGGQGLLEQQN
jgi:hypothetical protein